MKTIMITTIAVVILVTSLGSTLMIGAPSAQSVLAKKHHLTDTEQEDSTASDKLGRLCDFGPSQTECHDPRKNI